MALLLQNRSCLHISLFACFTCLLVLLALVGSLHLWKAVQLGTGAAGAGIGMSGLLQPRKAFTPKWPHGISYRICKGLDWDYIERWPAINAAYDCICNPRRPRPSTCTFLMLTTDGRNDRVDLSNTLSTMKMPFYTSAKWTNLLYSASRGYSYLHVDLPEERRGPWRRASSWLKLPIAHELSHYFDYVFYLDTDVILSNVSFALEHMAEQLEGASHSAASSGRAGKNRSLPVTELPANKLAPRTQGAEADVDEEEQQVQLPQQEERSKIVVTGKHFVFSRNWMASQMPVNAGIWLMKSSPAARAMLQDWWNAINEDSRKLERFRWDHQWEQTAWRTDTQFYARHFQHIVAMPMEYMTSPLGQNFRHFWKDFDKTEQLYFFNTIVKEEVAEADTRDVRMQRHAGIVFVGLLERCALAAAEARRRMALVQGGYSLDEGGNLRQGEEGEEGEDQDAGGSGNEGVTSSSSGSDSGLQHGSFTELLDAKAEQELARQGFSAAAARRAGSRASSAQYLQQQESLLTSAEELVTQKVCNALAEFPIADPRAPSLTWESVMDHRGTSYDFKGTQ